MLPSSKTIQYYYLHATQVAVRINIMQAPATKLVGGVQNKFLGWIVVRNE